MSTANSPLSISVGDRVVYPNQGLCKVTGINTQVVAGQSLSFITLQREEDGSKVMVPEAKVLAIGVRRVAGADDVAKIFSFLKSDSDKASLDWKARARTNVERMSVGGLMGLTEVVKGLQVLSELRPLPTKERGLYNDARHLLVTELSAALTIPPCDAEDALDAVLFPPGKDRPKRTQEEFKALGGDDDLGMGDDLLGLDPDAALEEPQEESTEEKVEGEEGEAAEAEEGDEAPKKKGKPAKGKAPAAKVEAKPARAVISDFEVTEAQAAPIDLSLPQPKKRGRPPKPKPAPAPEAAPKPAPARVEISHFAARPLPKPEPVVKAAPAPAPAPKPVAAPPKPVAKAVVKAAPKAAPAKVAAAKKKPAAKAPAKKKK